MNRCRVVADCDSGQGQRSAGIADPASERIRGARGVVSGDDAVDQLKGTRIANPSRVDSQSVPQSHARQDEIRSGPHIKYSIQIGRVDKSSAGAGSHDQDV